MEFGGMMGHFKDKTILVIGSTGFLGKIFVEKMLRVQPNLKKLFLLVRDTHTQSAKQRVQSEVIEHELFKGLREEYGHGFHSFISEKVSPVAGDIIYDNLGIEDANLNKELWNEIDFVVNIAASTNFYQRYDVALAVNTMGAKHVLEFAKKCVNLEMLLHVSTAYVGDIKESGIILEQPCLLGKSLKKDLVLDIEAELRLVKERKKELHAQKFVKMDAEKVAMKELGLMRAKYFGWPNTYAFTKAMGEMLLGHYRGNMTISIVRPTIITSIYKDPLPGWLEGTRTVDSFIIPYAKGQLPCVIANSQSALDVIPGDMVVNAMIVTMVADSNKKSESIYHIGSSMSNPLTIPNILQYANRYFTENPCIGMDGRSIKCSKPFVFKHMACFHLYMALRYGLPLMALFLINVVSCQLFSGKYNQLRRKYKLTMFLIELYKPYILFKGIFDDRNMNKLRMEMLKDENEADILDFFPQHIKWDDYCTNIHLPGFVKHAMD